jgi:heme exporter protein C
MSRGADLLTRSLGWLTLVAMAVALFGALVYAPTERAMGVAQRVFYVHVPSAWTAFLAFFVVAAASILYLWRGERRWDILALSSAELGVILTSLALITGSLWGKVVWGTWWTWEARLTSTLVLWLIYVAYLMLRAYTEGPHQARFAAVLGIVGALDIPIIFFSVRWWRTLHPELMVLRPSGPALEPKMSQALLVSVVAFTLLYIYLLIQRVRLERARDEVEALKERGG